MFNSRGGLQVVNSVEDGYSDGGPVLELNNPEEEEEE